jgi:hypothetical protein
MPKESIVRRKFGALHGAQENTKVVPERQVLQLERGS